MAPDYKDIEIFARNAKGMNREAMDVLEYKHYPSFRAVISQDMHRRGARLRWGAGSLQRSVRPAWLLPSKCMMPQVLVTAA